MSDPDTDTDEPSLDLNAPDQYLDCQWLPRDEIEPNDWNPNVIEDEEQQMLKQSILNNGWTRPIVVHAEDLYIIDGEQRWTVAGQFDEITENEALTPEGVPAGHVPVFGITISEDEAKVSTIQHNRARGFVDYNSLYDYFDEFQQEELLDDLADELDFEQDDLLRIVENESVSESIAGDHELSRPWEPRDIRDLEEEEVETTTRTKAMAETSSDDAGDIDRVSMVFSPGEKEKIESVFGEEDTAETLMRYIRYLDENDMIDTFRKTVGIEPDEEYPHPDTIAYGDDEAEAEAGAD